MQLTFGPLGLDPPLQSETPLEVLVSVVGTIQLESDGEVLLTEPYFPVVELAGALQRWTRIPADVRTDFEFGSMDYEETGTVWIRGGDGGWQFGSVLQEMRDVGAQPLADVEAVIRDFVLRLEGSAQKELGIDLTPVWQFLDGPPSSP